MLRAEYPYYLGKSAVIGAHKHCVFDKFTHAQAATFCLADAATIDKAIEMASDAQSAMASIKSYQRRDILEHCVKRFTERFDELANVLCIEAGKPIRDSRGEVERLIDTFRIAAAETTRLNGDYLNLEHSKRTSGLHGFTKRVPVGVCSFITPFNFPLNLVAHKVAPAIAAGCPFILKPALNAPIGALLIAEILAETDIPVGSFSVLPCKNEDAAALIEDDRIALLSFTGGLIGWQLKQRAGKKRVVLELGGNASCIVDADQKENLKDVTDRLIFGAFYQSGQSCVSVQRILIHQTIYESLKQLLIDKTRALIHGNPLNEDTFISPVIDEKSALRIESWINAAVAAGAKKLCGGIRDGNLISAALLEEVPKHCDLYRKEAFGPVAILSSFKNFDQALDEVNDSDFGLQAGVFTDSMAHAHRAWDRLEVGAVVIGDVPSVRSEAMPYGGVKDSGLGREGVRYAIEHLTEPRLMLMRRI